MKEVRLLGLSGLLVLGLLRLEQDLVPTFGPLLVIAIVDHACNAAPLAHPSPITEVKPSTRACRGPGKCVCVCVWRGGGGGGCESPSAPCSRMREKACPANSTASSCRSESCPGKPLRKCFPAHTRSLLATHTLPLCTQTLLSAPSVMTESGNAVRYAIVGRPTEA
jgi:hypothetical protein